MKVIKKLAQVLVLSIPAVLPSCTPVGERITSGPGPEDLARIRGKHGDMIVAASVKRSVFTGRAETGRIELFRIGKDREFKTVFEGGNSGTFRFYPAGICHVQRSEVARWKGKSLLYVTNELRQTVEVFEVKGERIHHLDSLGQLPESARPNGIAAFPDGSVYVSNMSPIPAGHENPRVVDWKADDEINTILEYRPRADGMTGDWYTCVTGIKGPNGVAAGPGGRSLLVCSWFSKKVWSFARSPKIKRLVHETPVELIKDLPFHPDNVKQMGEGHYELCGQVSFPKTAFHMVTGLPVSRGGWISFDWDGCDLHTTNRSALLNGHCLAPSTALFVGGNAYVGQPIAAGVFKVRGTSRP